MRLQGLVKYKIYVYMGGFEVELPGMGGWMGLQIPRIIMWHTVYPPNYQVPPGIHLSANKKDGIDFLQFRETPAPSLRLFLDNLEFKMA